MVRRRSVSVLQWAVILVILAPAPSHVAAGALRPQEFGVVDEAILTIGATSFVPTSASASMVYWGNVVSCNNGGCALFAPVQLPSGVRITSVRVVYYDGNLTDDPDFLLFRWDDAGSVDTVAGGSISAPPKATRPWSFRCFRTWRSWTTSSSSIR